MPGTIRCPPTKKEGAKSRPFWRKRAQVFPWSAGLIQRWAVLGLYGVGTVIDGLRSGAPAAAIAEVLLGQTLPVCRLPARRPNESVEVTFGCSFELRAGHQGSYSLLCARDAEVEP